MRRGSRLKTAIGVHKDPSRVRKSRRFSSSEIWEIGRSRTISSIITSSISTSAVFSSRWTPSPETRSPYGGASCRGERSPASGSISRSQTTETSYHPKDACWARYSAVSGRDHISRMRSILAISLYSARKRIGRLNDIRGHHSLKAAYFCRVNRDFGHNSTNNLPYSRYSSSISSIR
jgi:hypothetical protein